MVISIYKFLAVYYGIVVDTKTKFTHAAAKEKFPFLKGCSFKYAEDNPRLVSNGKIIFVVDRNKKVLPYYCPELQCEYIEDRKPVKGKPDYLKDGNVSAISTYELHESMPEYKDSSYYWVIKRELMARGEYSKKEYKLDKELLRLEDEEEGDFYDKYKRRQRIKRKKS